MESNTLPFSSDFLRRLAQLIPQSEREAVSNSFAKTKPTTLRVNTLKMTADELENALADAAPLERVPWYADAFIVKDTPLRALTKLPLYTQGTFYVQSLSSMIPPLILDPKPGDKVLDIAAAPGSKTTQMAALMQNQGEIIANDTSQNRIYRLQANLKIQGVTTARIVKSDGRSVWQSYPEYFDAVLVDAPCSMEGRFETNDPKSYEGWSLKKVRDLSMLQRWLLRSAISAAKVGGAIVYSTCTLSPEENEGVVDWILDKEKGKVALEEIKLPLAPFAKALGEWLGKKFNPELSKAVRIYPSDTMEGFFVAKFRKLKSNIPHAARA